MGGRVVRVARASLAVLGAVLGVTLLLPASPAAAHNSFTGSNPRDGARVAKAPESVELRFLAKLPENTMKITITGPDEASAVGGKPEFAGSRVRVPFTPGPAGEYTVAYELPSADGHLMKGKVTFTLTTGAPVEPTAEPTPSAEPSPSPEPAVPSAEPSTAQPAASPVPAAESSTDDGRPWLWGLGGLALVGALAAGLLLRRRATR
ncbi:copper resistance protein CopC [Micromonospora rosaria]|uniref:Copper resistance protein CopC n=1 Tax=Micromonospora rosaria TaxID=47874 RepID=A0A136PR75_9ACTN|nr:copper resistance CopC family protein [Micromonospora rosaria]KXK60933.1 copper resistance protein CopC [Micromonospora rosaria]